MTDAAPTEPLTLTFQEAVELLGREYRAALVFLPHSPDQRGDAWSTLSIDEEGYAVEDFAPTWEETMSGILGVPVVARDDAAELRAQVSRLQEALAFAQSVIKSGEPWSPTCDEVIGVALAAIGGDDGGLVKALYDDFDEVVRENAELRAALKRIHTMFSSTIGDSTAELNRKLVLKVPYAMRIARQTLEKTSDAALAATGG